MSVFIIIPLFFAFKFDHKDNVFTAYLAFLFVKNY